MILPLICLAFLDHGSAPKINFHAPAGTRFAKVDPAGQTILPNGRLLNPGGRRLYAGEDVWLSLPIPDSKGIVVFSGNALTIYDDLSSKPKTVAAKDIAPAGCFDPKRRVFYASFGDNGIVAEYDLTTWTIVRKFSANVGGATGSYINDVALDPESHTLFGVDVANQDLIAFDTVTGSLAWRVPAGREPYAISLDSKSKQVYVANIGLFDYSIIPKSTDPNWISYGLTKPPFAFPSKEAENGVNLEGRFVPGLGQIDAPGAQSVYLYQTNGITPAKLIKSVKTGLMIRAVQDGKEIMGGSAPNALLTYKSELYVSNANNDTVQVFDKSSLKLKSTIRLSPSPLVAGLRGVIPSGMTLDAAGMRLYVCESGLNAVAVIDTGSKKVLGHVPTGWFPVQVRLDTSGKNLVIACQKGVGRGPRGTEGVRQPTDERYGLSEFPGMAHVIPLPKTSELAQMSKNVLEYNGIVATEEPKTDLASLGIKHVVFITKENHTFDGIFGGLKGADGKADYAEFGLNGWIQEKGKKERVPIMPNHIKLAKQFAISDNFYMEPQASGDGHRWLVGVYPSLWTSRVFYAGWDFKYDDKTKGRLVSFGSNGSQIPEDYLENGSLWEHLKRGGITFRNYGEGFEFAGCDESPTASRAGATFIVNHPVTKALWENTCWNFPIFNTNIPDIAREQWFEEDIEQNYRAKGKPLPQFMNVTLCNDHGTGARKDWGYPYVCSYMADNDLALGRMVEYLSKQPEWKDTVVFVTQDDSGGDNDHVDRHRSFVLALGPKVKKGFVSHDHTSIMSIIKSIYGIFGLGPNNMFDAVATDLSDMFTPNGEVLTYTHVNSDPRVFKAEEAWRPNDPKFQALRWSKPITKMDDPAFVEWLHQRGTGDGD